MKRNLPWLILAVVLIAAYVTKPDDKTCIEEAVKAVWGRRVPNKEKVPLLYAEFMALNSQNVSIDDWIFVKRIRYRFPNREYNVGLGIFKQVIVND